jgi:hypothetical protein
LSGFHIVSGDCIQCSVECYTDHVM